MLYLGILHKVHSGTLPETWTHCKVSTYVCTYKLKHIYLRSRSISANSRVISEALAKSVDSSALATVAIRDNYIKDENAHIQPGQHMYICTYTARSAYVRTLPGQHMYVCPHTARSAHAHTHGQDSTCTHCQVSTYTYVHVHKLFGQHMYVHTHTHPGQLMYNTVHSLPGQYTHTYACTQTHHFRVPLVVSDVPQQVF